MAGYSEPRASSRPPRHSAIVRITHWATALSFGGLLVSGAAILLAHPRLYWGETGAAGSPSLIDLPLPFVLVGQSGWGRYLHFLSAWGCAAAGLVYIPYCLLSRHFRRDLLPSAADLDLRYLSQTVKRHLRFKRPPQEELLTYNVLQRVAYLTVAFALFPLMIWTGFAMSPALTSVFPALVTTFGGQQTARTIHFFAAISLVVFFLIHVAMVSVSGFGRRVRAMITGRVAGQEVQR